MADYCTHCAGYMFPDNIKPEIDLDYLFSTFEEDGEFYNALACEGCDLVAVGMFNGKKKVMFKGEKVWKDYIPEEHVKRLEQLLQGQKEEEENEQSNQ